MTIAVLGTGSWGTALAILLGRNGFPVKLWGCIPAEIEDLCSNRINDRYLPGIKLPQNVEVCVDLAAVVKSSRDLCLAVPSFVFRQTLQAIKPYLTKESRIVWGTKGLGDEDTFLHEIVKEVLGKMPIAVLSGPTFAREVAKELPTATELACNDEHFAKELVHYFHNDNFRVYTTSDLVGVEISGATKNVLAIAVGIGDGMGFGANTRAALITRGLAEIMRLGKSFGGQTETFVGLAGLGDLVLTCTDNQSRNRRFGLAIGAGKSRAEAEQSIGQVIEGITAARAIHLLAKRRNVEMPITEQVYHILYENLSPRDAVSALLRRAQKSN